MIEVEKSRKKSLEAFKVVGNKKSPFQKSLLHSQSKPHSRGCYYYAGKPGNQDVNIINMEDSRVRFKIIAKGNFTMEISLSSATQCKYLLGKSKGGPFTNNSKLVPLAS